MVLIAHTAPAPSSFHVYPGTIIIVGKKKNPPPIIKVITKPTNIKYTNEETCDRGTTPRRNDDDHHNILSVRGGIA